MSQLQYSEIQPDNNRSTYNPLDVVNFTLNNQGRSLVLGSLRLEGTLKVSINSNKDRATTEDIRFNKNAGIGAFIEGISVASALNGTMENIQFDYARYLNMVAIASKDANDSFGSAEVCELRAPDDLMTSRYCYGNVSTASTQGEADNMDFSHKMKICLNRAVEGDNLPFSRSGFMKISVSLARNFSAFYGSFQTAGDTTKSIATTNYELTDLTITYQTIPDVGQKNPVVMRTIVPIKSTLESDFSNIASSVPAKCDAVSISYQFTERENQVVDSAGNPQIWDNSSLNNVPNWDSIQYIFNNSNSEYISYIIDQEQEAVRRGIESLKDSGHNQVSSDSLHSNDSLIHGLSFGEMIDLSNQRFNIQVATTGGILSTRKMTIYCYFHSLINA